VTESLMTEPGDPGYEASYPKLGRAEIERLTPFGTRRSVVRGEVLFDQGDRSRSFFVVLEGSLEIVSPGLDGESRITVYHPGQFTGEVDILLGRPSLVRARAITDGSVLEIRPTILRQIVETDTEIGEILLRAFGNRRAHLVSNHFGGLVLIGSRFSSDTLRLKEFLARNDQPFAYLDLETDAAVKELLEKFAFSVADIPVVICRNQPALRNPSNAEVAKCLGFNPQIDKVHVHDVVIVGAGPSGLAAAVYAASEGLEVLVLEGSAPGGQAGSSSHIENYLGFPSGITGQDLADRAFIQAEKFGAQVAVACTVHGVTCDSQPFLIRCTGAESARGRTVVIASGAEYRRLSIPNLNQFEGVGVYYDATVLEAQLCANEEVAVVGGGNSAGQAATFLAKVAKHVYMIVRGTGLGESMSQYLIRRIEEIPTITLHLRTHVVALEGKTHLEKISWKSDENGQTETREIRHLFSMTGATPNTAWLGGCLALDDRHFIKTGADLSPEELRAAHWPLRRQPYLFETGVPRIFAIGDVRSGSVKRVASAVGEGSVVVQLLHKVLAE
jgi:thioredoxin reductase (NADPH)